MGVEIVYTCDKCKQAITDVAYNLSRRPITHLTAPALTNPDHIFCSPKCVIAWLQERVHPTHN